mgnify:CR=1 FL=1
MRKDEQLVGLKFCALFGVLLDESLDRQSPAALHTSLVIRRIDVAVGYLYMHTHSAYVISLSLGKTRRMKPDQFGLHTLVLLRNVFYGEKDRVVPAVQDSRNIADGGVIHGDGLVKMAGIKDLRV